MKIVISDQELDPSHHKHRIDDVLDTIADACERLETLAQIQATVGGMSMEHRSGKTFECQAKLENYLAQLRHGTGYR